MKGFAVIVFMSSLILLSGCGDSDESGSVCFRNESSSTVTACTIGSVSIGTVNAGDTSEAVESSDDRITVTWYASGNYSYEFDLSGDDLVLVWDGTIYYIE